MANSTSTSASSPVFTISAAVFDHEKGWRLTGILQLPNGTANRIMLFYPETAGHFREGEVYLFDPSLAFAADPKGYFTLRVDMRASVLVRPAG